MINDVLKKIIYFLLILSVYWGVLLTFFSFQEFFEMYKINANYFQLAYGLLGLLALLNAWYYHKKLKSNTVISLWNNFYQKQRNNVLITAVLTTLFIILLNLRFEIIFSSSLAGFLNIIALPYSFADNIIFSLNLSIREIVPFLELINQLGWMLSLAFEIVFFYYISRGILFFSRKFKKKKSVKAI